MKTQQNILALAIFVLLLSSPLCIWADNVPIFTASAAENVAIGDQFRLTFTVDFPGALSDTDIKDFTPPKLQGFNVLMGPSRATAKNVMLINGKNTVNDKISYSYILSALQEGEFVIPEATVTVKGQLLHSQPLTIRVLSAGQPQPVEKKKVELDVFMTMKISERSSRVNSPIVLECKLYATTSPDSIADIEQLISLEDFKVESINLKGNQWQLEHYQGKNYHTTIFRKLLLYPRRTGELRIGDFYMNTYYYHVSEDPFDAFFSGKAGHREIKKRIGCPGFTIHVYE
ncbi:BatD family protein [Bacteroides sp.]|uniref:BatD family protein n=1 Tax=Bacteroides sp. TaxID=29523 RepID=UPI0025BCBD55|nr:BatD family protein [Bacteroides sp.]